MSNTNNQNYEEENYLKDFENQDDFKHLLENLDIQNIDIKTSNEVISNAYEYSNNAYGQHLSNNAAFV